jgi:hypothetical protein
VGAGKLKTFHKKSFRETLLKSRGQRWICLNYLKLGLFRQRTAPNANYLEPIGLKSVTNIKQDKYFIDYDLFLSPSVAISIPSNQSTALYVNLWQKHNVMDDVKWLFPKCNDYAGA